MTPLHSAKPPRMVLFPSRSSTAAASLSPVRESVSSPSTPAFPANGVFHGSLLLQPRLLREPDFGLDFPHLLLLFGAELGVGQLDGDFLQVAGALGCSSVKTLKSVGPCSPGCRHMPAPSAGSRRRDRRYHWRQRPAHSRSILGEEGIMKVRLARIPIVARGSRLFLYIISNPTTKCADFLVKKKVQNESRI